MCAWNMAKFLPAHASACGRFTLSRKGACGTALQESMLLQRSRAPWVPLQPCFPSYARRGSQNELGRARAAKHHSLKYLLLDALSNGLSQALSTASSNLTAGAESAVLQGRNVVLWALGEVLPCIETPRVLFVASASMSRFSARQTGLKLQPYMPMTAVLVHTHLDIC